VLTPLITQTPPPTRTTFFHLNAVNEHSLDGLDEVTQLAVHSLPHTILELLAACMLLVEDLLEAFSLL